MTVEEHAHMRVVRTSPEVALDPLLVGVAYDRIPSGALEVLPGPADRSGARGDDELVDLWLRTGRRTSEHTKRAYRRDVERFREHLGRRGLELRRATVRDVQDWADGLVGAPSTRARAIAAARSLLSFGQKTGYLAFNVGTAVQGPGALDHLAERILTEEQVWGMLRTMAGRCGLLVRFLYASGARVDEACSLTWDRVHFDSDGTARITIHGKRQKTRHVIVLASIAHELLVEQRDAGPVFRTRSGKSLHPANAAKCVRAAAVKAGLREKVSPHWLRHAHASHALDRGASVATVRESLGHSSLATTGRYLHVRPKDSAGLYLKGL